MKTATIKLTAAIVVDGKIAKAGTIIDAPEDAAKGLILRGKAELATAADEPAEEVETETEGDDKPKAKPKK